MSLAWMATTLSSFQSGPEKRIKHTKSNHAEGYDDDGHSVITMRFSKFARDIRDYSRFLDNGARRYIVLTIDDEEAFHFEPYNPEKHPEHLTYRQVAAGSKSNIPKKCHHIFDAVADIDRKDQSPVLLIAKNRGVYGVLHPIVEKDPEVK